MFNEKQKWHEKEYRFDIDSSPEAFNRYNCIYSDEVKNLYVIEAPIFFRYDGNSKLYLDAPTYSGVNRLYAIRRDTSVKKNISIYGITYSAYEPVERLSGDCFFNFNQKKVSVFKTFEGVNIEKLEMCEKMHHNIENMVLLQTLGNLQKQKSEGLGDWFDRGDSFLTLLDYYYNNKGSRILDASTFSNREYLSLYLDRIGNVNSYANQMLQIDDEDFVKQLVEHGRIEIDKTTINQYLDDALEFWKIRGRKISNLDLLR